VPLVCRVAHGDGLRRMRDPATAGKAHRQPHLARCLACRHSTEARTIEERHRRQETWLAPFRARDTTPAGASARISHPVASAGPGCRRTGRWDVTCPHQQLKRYPWFK
jgi:hypothetical protein